MNPDAFCSHNKRPNTGRRIDLENKYFRSSWEANYARYLNWLIKQGLLSEWKYESETFEFEKIKRGSRFYTPDFKLIYPDGRIERHEVKGYMDARSSTKLKRMKKYFPESPIILIDRDCYASLAKQVAPLFPEWEGRFGLRQRRIVKDNPSEILP